MDAFVILSAFVLDLIFDDPRWLPHPVRCIGWMITRTETVLGRLARSARAEKVAGVVLVIVIISLVSFAAQFLVSSAFRISPYIGFILSVTMAYTTLAARGLSGAAHSVLFGLNTGDLASARRELSMIVGRDTAELDEREIVRAVIETVAENASDGVVAPLFYLAIGGPVLAMVYKAINTLDSMVGYKNARYLHFGWAAARLDDIANYIPARITALLLALASWFVLGSARTAWHMIIRDGRSHPSPNSGYPEAAMAGALGVRLGGPSSYGGIVSPKPFIGEGKNVLDKKYIEKSITLMYCASLLAAATASLGAAAINL
jgi:adenosylcobinamide-phosphate synthase